MGAEPFVPGARRRRAAPAGGSQGPRGSPWCLRAAAAAAAYPPDQAGARVGMLGVDGIRDSAFYIVIVVIIIITIILLRRL